MQVLYEDGGDVVWYALWYATGWHRGYSPPAWRNRATTEQITAKYQDINSA